MNEKRKAFGEDIKNFENSIMELERLKGLTEDECAKSWIGNLIVDQKKNLSYYNYCLPKIRAK